MLAERSVNPLAAKVRAEAPGRLLQRKCDCGKHLPAGGQCESCAVKKKRQQGLQKRLRVGHDNDPLEREADRVAAKVVTMPQPGTAALSSSGAAPRVRRRASASSAAGVEAPAIVNSVVNSAGAPLGDSVRQFMEPRFGADFDAVRVHTDARAAASAAAVDAQAYTVGNNIVFNAGAYQPDSQGGRELLAHELAHTLQQSGAASEQQVSRKGGTVGGFFANIGRWFAGLVGLEPKYDEDTLKQYIEVLKTSNDIEDDFDSDNKARAVILQGLYTKLSTDIKILLVKELLKGFTGDDDEQAILILLENTKTISEREKIAEKVTYAALYDNFHTAELKQLYNLLPLMKLFHPQEKVETKVHTLDDYIKKWEKEKKRSITANEKNALGRGCIGITMLNIGITNPPKLLLCYSSFEKAYFKAKVFNEFLQQNFPNRKAIIFSKRFWSGGKDYSADPKTGQVDMSKYDYSARPGYVNYDYGFFDETTKKWWHANHCEPSIRGPQCKSAAAIKEGRPDPMYVYESNLSGYSKPLRDFDTQVFCIGFARI